MSFTVQHKRSGDIDRRPKPTELVNGQVGINYNSASAGMFFRTDTGAIIKVGPAHIGSSAPVQTNWSERSVGEMWLDTTDGNILKMWSGSKWLEAQEGRIEWEIWDDGTDKFIRAKETYDVIPRTDGASQLGTANYRWKNVFTHDIDLSNEGGANDVDGTWGSYLIQEGEDDLFLVNRRSGKKFRFMLEEVK